MKVTPDSQALGDLSAGDYHAAELLAHIATVLPENGYDDPRRDARHLLAMALGRVDPVLPHEDVRLEPAHMQTLSSVVDRRRSGEPISRIRGKREFYGLDFAIDPSTLDPRADSEVIVDTARDIADAMNKPALSLVDFGTGSGCLLLSTLYHVPHATGIGVDIQEKAVHMATLNAASLGLADRSSFINTSWDQGMEGQFDLILSNPPYIPKGDLADLMDEVKYYDPVQALDGGHDGLDAWSVLAPIFKSRLAPHGAVIVEIGQGQHDDVTALMQHEGLMLDEQRCDLAGIIRCLVFTHQI